MEILSELIKGFVALGLKDWEQWSYVAVIFTLFVNGGFFVALIVQIRQGRKTLVETQLSTKAAEAAVREARRARIDEQAPRIIATLESPSVHGVRNGSEFAIEADPEFVMPKMKDARLFIITFGTLVNEGRGTAGVRLNGNGACFLEKEEDDPLFITELQSSKDERILRPGDSVRFAWSDSHSIEEWIDAYNNPDPPNPMSACFMEVIVRDYLEDGVIDNLYLEMAGRPLEPVEGDAGRWKYGKEGSLASVSYPSRRTYRKEERQDGLQPPWAKSYEQWNERRENGESG